MAVLIHLEPKSLMLFSLRFVWLWAILRFLETEKLVDPHCSLEDLLCLRPQFGNPGIGEWRAGKAQGN